MCDCECVGICGVLSYCVWMGVKCLSVEVCSYSTGPFFFSFFNFLFYCHVDVGGSSPSIERNENIFNFLKEISIWGEFKIEITFGYVCVLLTF